MEGIITLVECDFCDILCLLDVNLSIFACFQKVKMVLTDQKADRKNVTIVANLSDRATTSQFI